MTLTRQARIIAVVAALMICSTVAADQVILDDMIVDGSACIGVDCVNGEPFAFDALRLKENNLRIRFQDTSNSSAFPTNDWQIIVNDSSNGGASYFAIEDSTLPSVPFKIDAGAPTDSLYVGGNGKVGIGTSMPQMPIHVSDGDTPVVRLEQNGMGGFSPQTWDISGNETSFFVRDVSSGGTLPFRIRPGAATNSLDVGPDGVGIGTSTPDGFCHVYRDTAASIDPNTDAALLVETNTGSMGDNFGVVAKNNGSIIDAYLDTSGSSTWYVKAGSGGYEVYEGDGSTTSMSLTSGGDMTITGVLSEGSSRNAKHNITDVDGNALLDAVSNLPIKYWRYLADPHQSTHIGPMAEDFYATFGVGVDNRHLASLDSAGVALASVQALNDKLEAQNLQLREQNEVLQKRLGALESAVSKLLAK